MSGIDVYPSMTYSCQMLTIVETTAFSALWPDYWTTEEFGAFCAWLAVNPMAGEVVPKSAGCRKVRWSLPGAGKRGGTRVIYFTRLDEGQLWLVTMYAKNERSSVPGHELATRSKSTRSKSTRSKQAKHHGKTHRKGTHLSRR